MLPDDDSIGYGKPPRRTRFTKGQSGNPAGRPKGALNLATSLSRILKAPVVVTQHGRRRTITKFEAALTQLANQAAAGQTQAQTLLLRYLLPVIERTLLTTPASDTAWPEADQRVLTQFLSRLHRLSPGGSDHASQSS